MASLGIWSPADSLIRSPRTIFSGSMVSSSPARMTMTSSLLIKFNLSIIRLARSSVAIPDKALKQMTAKKTRLLQACTATKARAITKFKALNKVKTLRLMICQVLVLVFALNSLVWPRCIFLRTSSWVNPFNSFISIKTSYHFFKKKTRCSRFVESSSF